jgi:hypothetical protein
MGRSVITAEDARQIGMKIPPGYRGPGRDRRYGPWPRVGQMVCDCRMVHQRIVWVDPDDRNTVRLQDGYVCSFLHCCDIAPHAWEHA